MHLGKVVLPCSNHYEVRPMKKFITLSAAALLLAGLAGCGSAASTPGSSDSSSSSSSSSSSAQAERAVPDVVGMTYKEAYGVLVKDEFYAQLVDPQGATWLTGNPWDDVKVASTDPVAGTMTDVSYINVALDLTQDEYAAETKTEK